MYQPSRPDIRRPASSGFAANNGRVLTIEEAPAARRALPLEQYARTLPSAFKMASTYGAAYSYKQPHYCGQFLRAGGARNYPLQQGQVVHRKGGPADAFAPMYERPRTAQQKPVTAFDCGFRRNIRQPQATVPWSRPAAQRASYQTVNQLFQSYVSADRRSWRELRRVAIQ